jgi:hypothetical protein
VVADGETARECAQFLHVGYNVGAVGAIRFAIAPYERPTNERGGLLPAPVRTLTCLSLSGGPAAALAPPGEQAAAAEEETRDFGAGNRAGNVGVALEKDAWRKPGGAATGGGGVEVRG